VQPRPITGVLESLSAAKTSLNLNLRRRTKQSKQLRGNFQNPENDINVDQPN
jgi:hypothetical protein